MIQQVRISHLSIIISSKRTSIDPLRKPPELHALIENFCLGTRRLEIFGRASSLRRGWVTVGDIDDAAFELEKVGGKVWEKEGYEEELARIREPGTGKHVVTTTPGTLSENVTL